MEIANMKEGFHVKIMDLKEDSGARVSWLWDELRSAREENR